MLTCAGCLAAVLRGRGGAEGPRKMGVNNVSCGHGVPAGGVHGQWAGLTLALLSAILIGGSVILKKKALLRLANRGQTRAGEGGHGYLKDCLWWSGLLTMGAGEACNFAAYMFAAATLVTPLGALSVLVSALFSCFLLGEELSVLGKLGCLLCVLGSILLVIHAPQEQEVTSLQEMSAMLLQPGFVAFMTSVSLLCGGLVGVSWLAPGVARSSVVLYVAICSLLGAFTVSSIKGLAIAIRSAVHDVAALSHPLTWILLPVLLVSIVTQVHYLNKSLDTFDTQLVYPVYYVLFTSVVLCTSVVLFREWNNMAAVDVVTTIGAFLIMVVGVVMLQLFKETQITMTTLTNQPAQPVEREELADAVADNPGGARGGGGATKEDKYTLVDNMVVDSRPPVASEGPTVFIIS
ncbi:magnesium transporter NIPA2-like isoform X2 [Nerophis ophidion]|uniref:magnesium transporter NIPA2-like isoform X2 n=1 Tax=Nerophis ophidion TaxID=159077 RepID=UPI002AE08410|nr:magnesium transporter NIPA2-like isoform X2 [Nerophis ophidion]